MPKILLPLAAATLLAGGVLASTSASAWPVDRAFLNSEGAIERVGWAESLDRGGRRFLRTTKRYAPKERVSSSGNVKHPNRPARQAGWGAVPGGPRRAGQ